MLRLPEELGTQDSPSINLLSWDAPSVCVLWIHNGGSPIFGGIELEPKSVFFNSEAPNLKLYLPDSSTSEFHFLSPAENDIRTAYE